LWGKGEPNPQKKLLASTSGSIYCQTRKTGLKSVRRKGEWSTRKYSKGGWGLQKGKDRKEEEKGDAALRGALRSSRTVKEREESLGSNLPFKKGRQRAGQEINTERG